MSNVELRRNIVIFARFASDTVTLIIIFFLFNMELFASVGELKSMFGIIESTKNVTLEEFVFPALSFAYIFHVFEPSEEDNDILFPQAMVVFVAPLLVVYQQEFRLVSETE